MKSPGVPRIIKKIYSENASIYLATRIYDYIEKIQAEMFENYINMAIRNALNRFGLEYERKITFVPFRDTKEHEIDDPNRARIIYERDIKRLISKDLIALVTLYNDISKDEGISFEIGYAYGRRVPIFVLNTDFIWYALRSNPKYEFVVDPVIQNMVYKYLHSYEIHNEEDVFINNLYSGLTRAFKKMEEELYNFLLSPSNYKTKSFEFSCKLKNVFIDFCGGKCEYHRSYMEKLKKKIQKLGVNVTTSIRFDPKIDFKDIKLIERGKIDIENLLKSSVVIFSAEEPEMDSGSAALLGLAKALNKEIILYYSGNIEIHGDGGHKMIKNLMIDYSVDYFCNKFHMIPNIVEETLGEE